MYPVQFFLFTGMGLFPLPDPAGEGAFGLGDVAAVDGEPLRDGRAGRSAADVFDVFTICLVFTLMCARLNCMISGCCLGAHIPIEGLTHLRFPTRELELLFYVLLLSRLWRKVVTGRARGMIYPIYMISYGIFRFVTETLRFSDRTDSILHISHLWALLSLGIGISIYGELQKKEKKTGGRRNG